MFVKNGKISLTNEKYLRLGSLLEVYIRTINPQRLRKQGMILRKSLVTDANLLSFRLMLVAYQNVILLAKNFDTTDQHSTIAVRS